MISLRRHLQLHPQPSGYHSPEEDEEAVAPVDAVYAVVRLDGVRSITLFHLRDAPHLTVVNHSVLGQPYQPLARLVVAPIGVHDVVSAACAQQKEHHCQQKAMQFFLQEKDSCLFDMIMNSF